MTALLFDEPVLEEFDDSQPEELGFEDVEQDPQTDGPRSRPAYKYVEIRRFGRHLVVWPQSALGYISRGERFTKISRRPREAVVYRFQDSKRQVQF